jgi:hypothetical protein
LVGGNGRNTERHGHPTLALLPFAIGIFITLAKHNPPNKKPVDRMFTGFITPKILYFWR